MILKLQVVRINLENFYFQKLTSNDHLERWYINIQLTVYDLYYVTSDEDLCDHSQNHVLLRF